jgi:uncharacterized membrane protein YeaQ/YmgE (transglycosylase-associated protein family)
MPTLPRRTQSHEPVDRQFAALYAAVQQDLGQLHRQAERDDETWGIKARPTFASLTRHRGTPIVSGFATLTRRARAAGGKVMFGTESLLVILIVGLIAGWLAGKIMRGSGYGIIGDIIIGIIGAFIGAWLWGVLHLPTIGNIWVDRIVVSTVGAMVLLFILGLIKRA